MLEAKERSHLRIFWIARTNEIKDKASMEPQATSRLVIRIKLPPQAPPPAPARRPLSKGALLLVLGPVAALLIWAGISMFATDRKPPPSTTPAPAPSEAAPVVSTEPPPKPATEVTPVEPEAPKQRAPSASPSNEVIPDVPRSARNTIRGTIRVTIRVIVDTDGTVLAATADEPGPSRYFERLSVEAARKWTFARAPEQRVMLVRFYFKRSGTTARASTPQ
jgi:TonB family protein